jgi:hypothetical protein
VPLPIAGHTPPVTGPDDTLFPRRARVLLYAERPRRRLVQVVADIAVLVWILIGFSLATALRDLVLTLQGAGRGLADAGGTVAGTFEDAAGAAGSVPFVGDRLARALGGGTQAGQSLVDAGNAQVETVGAVATGLAALVVLVAVLPVVALWLWLRVRWVLRARQAAAARELDVDLLALRALTRSSPARLARVAPDAAGAWRRAEPAVLARLAEIELSRLGLRPPTTVRVHR